MDPAWPEPVLLRLEEQGIRPTPAGYLRLSRALVGAGRRLGLARAAHPQTRPLAVPNGVGVMAAQLGMHVTVCHPQGYEIDSDVKETMELSAREEGGSLTWADDLEGAVEGAEGGMGLRKVTERATEAERTAQT